MIGPKLDARTYAIMILAVIALVASVNLVAQQYTAERSGVSVTSDVATATREVAKATERVAESNAQIAEALRELAGAVREVRTSLDKQAEARAAEARAAEAQPAAPARPAAPPMDEGYIEFGP